MTNVNDLFMCPELQIFVLPGFQSEIKTFMVNDLAITRLPIDLWHLIENDHFVPDLLGDYLSNKPFFCIFTSSVTTPDEEKSNVHASRVRKLKRFVMSIRLMTQSAIEINPADFIQYERIGNWNCRTPGRYGRKSYEFSSDYNFTTQEIESIRKIYEILTEYEENYQLTEISFARDLFEQSYDIALNPLTKKTLLLLGTIEALVDTSNIWLLKRVKWDNDIIKRFLKNYRGIRNLLAHGKELNDDTIISCLITISRALLTEAIVFSVENKSSNADEILQLNLINRLIANSKKGLILEKRFFGLH
ncbi:hypothetical protein [Neobacillus cucumis]|uniref:hypothetical protein n=1 Tax=Neobacillus cucumis TaxID=1740721 RepID=UPI002E1CB49D|nr:hypothetical protein [Neobacillus cucumis]